MWRLVLTGDGVPEDWWISSSPAPARSSKPILFDEMAGESARALGQRFVQKSLRRGRGHNNAYHARLLYQLLTATVTEGVIAFETYSDVQCKIEFGRFDL